VVRPAAPFHGTCTVAPQLPPCCARSARGGVGVGVRVRLVRVTGTELISCFIACSVLASQTRRTRRACRPVQTPATAGESWRVVCSQPARAAGVQHTSRRPPGALCAFNELHTSAAACAPAPHGHAHFMCALLASLLVHGSIDTAFMRLMQGVRRAWVCALARCTCLHSA
jgi:hypothetical protein